ncbi:MAG: pyridoxal phosphate-dependent aminotransferase [Leptospirales bacterium]|nr:pyridoxal phosphate-dependent aminotransferase [Leptospirales bacterium]
MRMNIVHIGAGELNYEIRQIVEVAGRVQQISGRQIFWENIGDPVQKGEQLPQWIKDIVAAAVQSNATYSYSPTRGMAETREFLAARSNALGGAQISPEDILFFNGLGDAVNKVYYMLRREARVIGPSPAYPTHSSAEASHAGYPPITYNLDPQRGWMPDLDELRNKVKYNESIAGIMIINPDNPTGAVFPRDVVAEMVEIARQYRLFIVADEIYMNMVFNRQQQYAPLAQVIGDVPAISLKGISKEIPWPGSRCGWMQVYNQEAHPIFKKYIKSILDAKMLEVCSTTLPQTVIPQILGDARYPAWQEERNAFFQRRSKRAAEIFARCPGVVVNPPDGAFYLSVVFSAELHSKMHLKIADESMRRYIDSVTPADAAPDRRFVYQLLGSRNICVVPLSSFVTSLMGFRCTLLERDDQRFDQIYNSIVDAIQEFLQS